MKEIAIALIVVYGAIGVLTFVFRNEGKIR
jgi:hypothetical protein